MLKFLSFDQLLCADKQNEGAVGRAEHAVDLVDADVAVFCRLLGGQCHFQMDRNGADAILHVKAPFLGLSAEQTSRRFQIVGSGAFAEAVSIEHDRDADLQDAVINSAVIQIDSLLHNGKRDIRGDDHGLAGQQPLVNHIEYALRAEQWHFMKPDERLPFLQEYLPEEAFRAYDGLFSDFRMGGYRVFGDIICDIDGANRQAEFHL